MCRVLVHFLMHLFNTALNKARFGDVMTFLFCSVSLLCSSRAGSSLHTRLTSSSLATPSSQCFSQLSSPPWFRWYLSQVISLFSVELSVVFACSCCSLNLFLWSILNKCSSIDPPACHRLYLAPPRLLSV